ncbi:NAD(P)H-dependent oxidoreductase [Phyllobacterium sp. 21LDTY02-6]|jgi:NAD(P)H-dependent FMN reductase|uniref:NADPH-dependent FMN reductase n=1 Tax=unclassified Phyllobacterium TaxID=2638441 RepID=UPI0020218B7A|nr:MULTISPECIES: NAD(P)H-dependent oxidoreductase [unclassified Phyllobacterium]MCO4316042.1 NAD(P)H-dependent oxidoreductase [Phyllobacterium sp. 21LDTY02-6]MCX8279535.1 NAD(P)H-dependent oxidoreductase [Phyllobacterium sp. 0TCS1.6C]MCX8292274.1 NAD(P)H-dependent oxidoreductase [Phyllobacterium sp. 0TCS1.6A]
MALKLNIIIASTRPGRGGPPVAEWFHEFVRQDGTFEPVLVDLADINLPLLDEPSHPRMKKYEHEHTKRWSAVVDAADAYVFVMPEYDYNAPPSLINALIYLWNEWNYKPASFVSYGGISGGMRAVESVKGLMSALRLVPLSESVPVPLYQNFINDEGVFQPNEAITNGAKTMLAELAKWAGALKPLRDA